MAERQNNPLFTRSEKGRVRKKIRHKIKGAARSGFARLFGISLSPGLGGTRSPRAAHRSRPHSAGSTASSSVRSEVIEALRGQGYKHSVAEKMTPRGDAGESFDSLFRRAMHRNPGELIIFGNPSMGYTRKGISKAYRRGNSIPSAIIEGLAIGSGLEIASKAFKYFSRKANPLPLAVLQGLQFGVGEKVAGDVLKKGKHSTRKRGRRRHNQTHRHNAGCGDRFCFHGAWREKSDAVTQEKKTPHSFIRNLRFGPGDYRWTVLTARGPEANPSQFVAADERLIVERVKNPDSLEKAGQLFQDFHHRDASGVYDTQRSAKLRKDFTILGPLVAIGINAEKYDHARRALGSDWESYKVDHWDKLPHLAFLTGPQVAQVKRIIEEPDKYVRNCPQLASSPNGKQLYAITPDGVDLSLSQFATDSSKDFVDLGEGTFVVYIAKKPDDAVEWVHELGEDGGTRPRLMYDRLKREIFFIGGSYTVEAPGILH